jgi:hypothetical protein
VRFDSLCSSVPSPFENTAGGLDNPMYSFTEWALAHAVVSSESFGPVLRWIPDRCAGYP